MGCQCAKYELCKQYSAINIADNTLVTHNIEKNETKNFSQFNTNSQGQSFLHLSNSMLENALNYKKNIGDSRVFKTRSSKMTNSLDRLYLDDKDYEIKLLNEINLVRKNPLSYIDKIKGFVKNIKQDPITKKKFYFINKNTKINLLRGKEAFSECQNFLSETNKKIESNFLSLDCLHLKEELKFPFPYGEVGLCTDQEYISNNLIKINENLSKKIELIGFYYDMNNKDPEISLIMQIVDDNDSDFKRRNLIFNDKVKYVGISIGRIKRDIFCIYLLFGI